MQYPHEPAPIPAPKNMQTVPATFANPSYSSKYQQIQMPVSVLDVGTEAFKQQQQTKQRLDAAQSGKLSAADIPLQRVEVLGGNQLDLYERTVLAHRTTAPPKKAE